MNIFLAGNIGKKIPNEYIQYKAPFVLQTFFDMMFWDEKLCEKAIKTPKMFFCDSGAFSFMNSAKSVDFSKYLDQYVSFVNRFNVKYFFELDLDVVIGVRETQKMTRYLEKKTQRQCIPVFHACRKMDGWRQMIREYKYVSIGASGITDECKWVNNTKLLRTLVSMAHQNGCKVHGLGYTRLSNINNTTVPFDSVDSSACLSGGRYGTVYRFTGTKLVSKSIKNRVKDYKTLNTHNVKEWIKMSNYKAGIK